MIEKLVIEYILNLATIYEVDRTKRKKARQLFEQAQYVLTMTENKKIRQFNYIINLFGISPVAFALFLLKKARRIIKSWKKVIWIKDDIMKKS